ncbi:hypothetical protein [Sporosarcina aquimarina]|uniref:Uncharacterized protein n=1 Tax=Sporosarcina aquimarina TaxID=114975 RepID=A0ABU4FZQ2_9BACL|nr:hypothetical protein [Sporosarcina aquimarina]MDW0110195.1 hypothetical protein [Sporosarcina aquimarina]
MSTNESGNEHRTKQAKESTSGVEYTDEQRKTNEVASTAYTGSAKKKIDLQNDRLETGGF